ncbi:hypothetical protein Tco_0678662 [Tanacetum coccineum]|uniref:Uncharacterized protein n=1 Tax=Tanacetum coccineum TaxID=301880 RepID=A0ABQ4XGM7_9ASTR
MYYSWKSRMELYMMNRQHRQMILESVENGLLIWPSIEENEVTRPKKYSELSPTEAIQADYVKLVRDLHTTNIDQLHAYLGQHEFHANEVRLMHERNSDPLALVATLQMNLFSPYQTSSSKFTLMKKHGKRISRAKTLNYKPQVSSYQSPQYGSPYQSQQYSTHQSSTPLLITYPSNDYQSSIHHNIYSPSSSIPQLEYPPSVDQQSEFSQQESGLIVPVSRISEGQATQTVITHNVAYQADDLDAYNSNCDELNTDKVALMRIPSEQSNVVEPCQIQKESVIAISFLIPHPPNVEIPKELPKVSMVNTSLKKLKYHLANFDVVVKE